MSLGAWDDPAVQQAVRETIEASRDEDPNAHLIGQSVEIDDQAWIIVGTWHCSDQYVVLENEDEREIIRAAGLVRRHLELTQGCVEDDYSEEAMP